MARLKGLCCGCHSLNGWQSVTWSLEHTWKEILPYHLWALGSWDGSTVLWVPASLGNQSAQICSRGFVKQSQDVPSTGWAHNRDKQGLQSEPICFPLISSHDQFHLTLTQTTWSWNYFRVWVSFIASKICIYMNNVEHEIQVYHKLHSYLGKGILGDKSFQTRCFVSSSLASWRGQAMHSLGLFENSSFCLQRVLSDPYLSAWTSWESLVYLSLGIVNSRRIAWSLHHLHVARVQHDPWQVAEDHITTRGGKSRSDSSPEYTRTHRPRPVCPDLEQNCQESSDSACGWKPVLVGDLCDMLSDGKRYIQKQ